MRLNRILPFRPQSSHFFRRAGLAVAVFLIAACAQNQPARPKSTPASSLGQDQIARLLLQLVSGQVSEEKVNELIKAEEAAVAASPTPQAQDALARSLRLRARLFASSTPPKPELSRGDFDRALGYLAHNSSPEGQVQFAQALLEKAQTLQNFPQTSADAEAAYRSLIDYSSTSPPIAEDFQATKLKAMAAQASLNLATLLANGSADRTHEARAVVRQMIARFDQTPAPDVQARVLGGLVMLGGSLSAGPTADQAEAMQLLNAALIRGPKLVVYERFYWLAAARASKALLYHLQTQHEAGFEEYERLLRDFGDDADPNIRFVLVDARFNDAHFRATGPNGDAKVAIVALEGLIQDNRRNQDLRVRRIVAKALINQGYFEERLSQPSFGTAIARYEAALKHLDGHTAAPDQYVMSAARINLASAVMRLTPPRRDQAFDHLARAEAHLAILSGPMADQLSAMVLISRAILVGTDTPERKADALALIDQAISRFGKKQDNLTADFLQILRDLRGSIVRGDGLRLLPQRPLSALGG